MLFFPLSNFATEFSELFIFSKKSLFKPKKKKNANSLTTSVISSANRKSANKRKFSHFFFWSLKTSKKGKYIKSHLHACEMHSEAIQAIISIIDFWYFDYVPFMPNIRHYIFLFFFFRKNKQQNVHY